MDKEKLNKIKDKLDSFYGISKNGSSFKVEIIAGIATFLAMAYILIVNPSNILFASGVNDPRWSSLFIATAFGAVIGTLLMSLLAKMPLAQAPGLGLNSAIGGLIGGGMGVLSGGVMPLPTALLLVFFSGIIFLILSVVPCGKDETGKPVSLREKIFDGVPQPIRIAIPVGIGLFIAFIGLQNAKVIVDDPYTKVALVNFGDWALYKNGGPASQALVCLFGLLVIGILSHFKIKGAVIFGILAATLLGLPLGVTDFNTLLGKTEGVTWKFWKNFANYFCMESDKGGIFFTLFTEGFAGFDKEIITTCVVTIISFCMIDMFDTMGTVVGCTTNAGLIDESGKPLNYDKIMYSDSFATCIGAVCGTSTVTTFVESGVGVAAGGKTGFTSLTTALLFFLSIFILPVFAFIPSAAAAPALIYVGVLMMSSVVDIDFTEIKFAVPAFLTILMMPLTYSITTGIGIGVVSYVLISCILYVSELVSYKLSKDENKQKPKFDLSIIMVVVFALFLVYFLTK